MLKGWILGKPITLHMWPESEGDLGKGSKVSLRNGTVGTSHVESELMKMLEPESANFLWIVSPHQELRLGHVYFLPHFPSPTPLLPPGPQDD